MFYYAFSTRQFLVHMLIMLLLSYIGFGCVPDLFGAAIPVQGYTHGHTGKSIRFYYYTLHPICYTVLYTLYILILHALHMHHIGPE